MTASFVFRHQETVVTDISQLPPFQAKPEMAMSLQIARHLKQTLKKLGKEANITLKLPSAILLADFYHCTPLDVLDALFTLKNQLYEYTMPGLDGEITLYGPVDCCGAGKQIPAWLYPWEQTHKLAENPLINLLKER